jgi:hypothetical protein
LKKGTQNTLDRDFVSVLRKHQYQAVNHLESTLIKDGLRLEGEAQFSGVITTDPGIYE